MIELPDAFRQRVMRDLGPEEGEALCAALNGPSPTAVRRHPIKGEGAPMGESIPWSEWGSYLAERPSFTLDPAFHAGAYYVQEASSQFVGRLLAGEQMAGKRLLDLCAAPGGKSTLYASLVGDKGLVVANEVDRKRVQILADNVRKWGLGNVVVTTNEAADFDPLEGWFDVVAVDAPCSGEGMFRRLPESREEWSEASVGQCAAIQRAILRSAWKALKPGGLLIYSTCTFNRTEDEEVLADFGAWAQGELQAVEPIAEAADWGIAVGRVGAFWTYRFYPHRAKGEGFFAAVVRKQETDGPASFGRRSKGRGKGKLPIQSVSKDEAQEMRRWMQEPDAMGFYRAGELLYAARKEILDEVARLSGVLRVVYAGVAMGEIYKGRLKPDAALAHYVGLNAAVLPRAELTCEEALAYLRKGELSAEWFTEGMNLVLYGGLSLGFAKRIGGRVNNLYPNSLRIMNK